MSSSDSAVDIGHNDRAQLFLKQRAKIDPSLSTKDAKRSLLDLPPDLIIHVFTLVFGNKVGVNINVLRRFDGTPSRQLMYSFPAAVSKLEGLFGCSRITRDYATIVLGQQVMFQANSMNFSDLPLAFGKDNCARIHKLDFHAHFGVKTGRDTVWADLLHIPFGQRTPNMMSGDPAGSVTRQNQECRSLMQFGAHLINLHPKLSRLIKDSQYGPEYKEGEAKVVNNYIIDHFGTKRKWQSRTSYTNASRTEEEVIEDEILNAPLIRRLDPTVLANTPIEQLVIKPSEGQSRNEMVEEDVPKQSHFYAMVDERAFRTKAEHEAKGWKQQSVRELISICSKIESQVKTTEGQRDLVENYLKVLDEAATAKAELSALQERVKAHVCSGQDGDTDDTNSPDHSSNHDDDDEDQGDDSPDDDNGDGHASDALSGYGHGRGGHLARGFGRGRGVPTGHAGPRNVSGILEEGNSTTTVNPARRGQNVVRLSYAAALGRGLSGDRAVSGNGTAHNVGSSANTRRGGLGGPAIRGGRGGRGRGQSRDCTYI
ncbi:hypothetical protein PMZ80_009042 [Knufia obscura]|uniref:Uncharacterized protein n=1 Tax=Knufia obscura TaxID=1635080 RepID=A0ABR0RE05_9EURO|nr:hypothetical protein PMZ80_009042 [Knufia obscura]